MHRSVDENVVTGGLQEPDPRFPLEAMAPCSLIRCLRRLYRTQVLQRRTNCISFCHLLRKGVTETKRSDEAEMRLIKP